MVERDRKEVETAEAQQQKDLEKKNVHPISPPAEKWFAAHFKKVSQNQEVIWHRYRRDHVKNAEQIAVSNTNDR